MQGRMAAVAEWPILRVATHAEIVILVLLRLILQRDGSKRGAVGRIVRLVAAITIRKLLGLAAAASPLGLACLQGDLLRDFLLRLRHRPAPQAATASAGIGRARLGLSERRIREIETL